MWIAGRDRTVLWQDELRTPEIERKVPAVDDERVVSRTT